MFPSSSGSITGEGSASMSTAPGAHVGYGGGDGDLYMEFMVETLKPYIDEHYRTMPGNEHTGIMGSSMGALISHYGAIKYQDVFTKAGIFSPSYWFSDSIWTFTRQTGVADNMRFYLMCGGNEGAGTINDMIAMQDTLLACGLPENNLNYTIIPGGQHNESLWRQDFENAYLWLYGSYANEVKEQPGAHKINLFPNPSKGILRLPHGFPDKCDSLEILGLDSKIVMKLPGFRGREINVSALPAGMYILTLSIDGEYYQGKFIKE